MASQEALQVRITVCLTRCLFSDLLSWEMKSDEWNQHLSCIPGRLALGSKHVGIFKTVLPDAEG